MINQQWSVFLEVDPHKSTFQFTESQNFTENRCSEFMMNNVCLKFELVNFRQPDASLYSSMLIWKFSLNIFHLFRKNTRQMMNRMVWLYIPHFQSIFGSYLSFWMRRDGPVGCDCPVSYVYILENLQLHISRSINYLETNNHANMRWSANHQQKHYIFCYLQLK